MKREGTMIVETSWSEPPERIIFEKRPEYGAYVPERTCTRGRKFWECSECGREALVSAFNYCPHCGARVVGDK